MEKYKNIRTEEFMNLEELDFSGTPVEQSDIDTLRILQFVRKINLHFMGLERIPQYLRDNTVLEEVGLYHNSIDDPVIKRFEHKHKGVKVF